MKKILALFLVFSLCFAFAACGGEEPEAPAAVEEPVAVTSIIGQWTCIDAKMVDNGEEIDGDMLADILGMKVNEMLLLTAYADGSGTMILLGEDEAAFTWTEADGAYQLTAPEGEETVTAKLENGTLTVTFTGTYDMDGTEVTTEMIYTMEYAGNASLILADWDLQMTDDQIRAMNNFMAMGWFVVADDYLYGSFGGTEFGTGTFCMAELNGSSLGTSSAIEADAMACYLSEYNGYIYGTINNDRIFKIKVGETDMEVIYEGYCDYVQVVDDKIYYCDENYHFLAMDLNGGNSETIIEKEVYFPYILPNDVILYQNDADSESLYLYNPATGDDVRLCEGPAYHPVLCGDYVYYQAADGVEALYTFDRVNVYTGATESDGCENDILGFYIENGNIYYTYGGLPAMPLAEWNLAGNQGFSGFIYTPRYSNGEVRLYSASNWECFITTDAFNTREDAQSIGYNYVAQ